MAWSHEEKSTVWFKGLEVAGVDSNQWRKDVCGAWMGWQYYVDRNSQYGWEIDHINPHGDDSLANLQPLQWENNAAKSNGKLVCATTSSGYENVPVSRSRLY